MTPPRARLLALGLTLVVVAGFGILALWHATVAHW